MSAGAAVARRRGRNRAQAPAKVKNSKTGGITQPPGVSGHGRGRMRNLGREGVARNAGEKDQVEPDGRL